MKLTEQISRMKSIMGINESTTNIPTVITHLAPQLAAAAQGVYDQWEQDEEGNDEIYGAGGICDDIADAMCEVISNNTSFGTFSLYNEHDYHTSIYVYDSNIKECYNVDISPYNYEIGAAYTWKKIPNVTFSPGMISITYVDYDHYINDEGEMSDELYEGNMLDEVAKTTNDLAKDTALYIDTTVDESIILLLHSVTDKITYAQAQIRQIDEDTYSVKTMSAESGYGPLMYDIVFSYIYPKCLMPDRNGQVSQEAWAVWEYYFNKRNDIKKTSLQPRDKLFNTAITHGSDAYLSPEEVEYLEAHNAIDKNVLKIYNTKYQGKPVNITGLLQNAKVQPKDKEGTIALASKHFRHNYMK